MTTPRSLIRPAGGNQLSVDAWRLTRRLAEAEDYLVYSSDGTKVGRLDHVLYERHHDHPDSIIIRRGFLGRRRFSVPFEAIQEVDERARVIALSVPANGITPIRRSQHP